MGITIVKKLLFTLLLACTIVQAEDYINKYFPENSILRQKHNNEPRGTWFGFDNEVRSACDRINYVFSIQTKLFYTEFTYMCHHPYESLEQDIRIVLADFDEEIIQHAIDWAIEVYKHLGNKAQEEYQKTSEYLAILAREKRREAIREELKKRDQNK